MDIEEKDNFENINSIIEAAQKNEIDLIFYKNNKLTYT